MRIRFRKMSGAGNDFVVIDNRSNIIRNGAGLARKLCDRRWGIGADGLLLLETSTDADYRMMYYNADGSYGGMCGNGGRCLARFAVEAGIAKPSHEFEALGYHYKSVVKTNDVVLAMKDPADIKMDVVLRIDSLSLRVHFINTGSPHVVIPIHQMRKKYKILNKIPVEGLGRKIRHHKWFGPEGTNVNFVDKRRDNILQMRTYERGVETETLACGTGSIASAIIGARLWGLTSPVTVLASSGIRLKVLFHRSGMNFSSVRLRGPAITTFEGEIDV